MYFSSVYFCCHSFHKLLHYMYLCAAIQQFCFLDLSKAFSFLFCFYSLLIRTVRICVLHTFSLIFIKYHTNCAHHSNQILFYIFYCLVVCVFFLFPSLFCYTLHFSFPRIVYPICFFLCFFLKKKRQYAIVFVSLLFLFSSLWFDVCTSSVFWHGYVEKEGRKQVENIFFSKKVFILPMILEYSYIWSIVLTSFTYMWTILVK